MTSVGAKTPSFATVVKVVVAVMAIAIAPSALVAVLWWPGAVTVAVTGSMAALPAALFAGRAAGFVSLVVFASIAPIAVLLADHPVGAAMLMAAVGVGAALATARGWSSIVGLWVIALGLLVVAPPSIVDTAAPDVDADYIGTLVALLLAFGLWAVVIGSVLGRRLPQRPRLPPATSVVVAYAAALVPALAVGTYLARRLDPGGNGAWIILTIVVLLRPSSFGDVRSHVLSRVAGTVAGGLAVVPLALLLPESALLSVLGAGALAVALALMVTGPYWWYSAWMTASVVLVESGGRDVLEVDGSRIEFTLVGVAVVVALGAVVEAATRVLHAGASPRT